MASGTRSDGARRAVRAGSVLLGLLLALWGHGGRARAQPGEACDGMDEEAPLAVTPAVGAGGVPTDAFVRVDFSPGRVPELAEPLVELWERDTERVVPGRIEVISERWVYFLPDEPLAPSTAYEGVARGRARDLAFHFRTGAGPDLGPPAAVSIEGVVVRFEEQVRLGCGEPVPGYVFSVFFSPVAEDGPPSSVEYLLLQTRGAGLAAPVLRGRTRGFPAERLTIGFALSEQEASEPMCLVALAVDGGGHVSQPGEPRCFDPVRESYFVGACSAGGPVDGGAGWLLLGVLLAARRRLRRC